MTKIINLIDSKNNKILELSVVQFKYDEILKLICLNLEVKFDIFSLKQLVEFEEADFYYLIDSLENLILNKIDKVSFNPMMDQRLLINFEIYNNIYFVNLKISNDLYNGSLNIKFETNKEKIILFITQTKSVINYHTRPKRF